MNSCYVLIKETNLDPLGNIENENPYCASKTVRVFSDFENAKQQMRAILKEYATSKNELFDGSGNILHLDDYLNACLCDDYTDEEESDLYLQLPGILRAHFLNVEPDDIEMFDMYTKYGIIVDAEDWGVKALCSYDRENDLLGIDRYDIPTPNPDYEITPVQLAINSFYMDNPEKTYVCRIEGEYENWDKPYFFYLELRKIDIE